jgi:hypothetical protein
VGTTTCLFNTTDTQCGRGGAQCAPCTNGNTCNGGACQCGMATACTGNLTCRLSVGPIPVCL